VSGKWFFYCGFSRFLLLFQVVWWFFAFSNFLKEMHFVNLFATVLCPLRTSVPSDWSSHIWARWLLLKIQITPIALWKSPDFFIIVPLLIQFTTWTSFPLVFMPIPVLLFRWFKLFCRFFHPRCCPRYPRCRLSCLRGCLRVPRCGLPCPTARLSCPRSGLTCPRGCHRLPRSCPTRPCRRGYFLFVRIPSSSRCRTLAIVLRSISIVCCRYNF
jgi:hypothetical protein